MCCSTDVDDTPHIVVLHDRKLKYRILYEAHDTALSGRIGREKTDGSVSQDYCLPKRFKWVSTNVRTCKTCQRVKSSAHAAEPIASLPVPTGCWESISINFMFGLSKDSYVNMGIVVFVDRLCKIAHLAAVPDTIDGEGTATLIIDRVFDSTVCRWQLSLIEILASLGSFGSPSLRCSAYDWTCPQRIISRPIVKPSD